MSLRKSPTRTQAFLAANRRNAQKSTGPRTRRGKARSCLNHLQTGWRSRVYRALWHGLANAPPCSVERTVRALLTPERAAHPLFGELVDLFRWAEGMVVVDARSYRELCEAKQKAWASGETKRQEPEHTEVERAPASGRGRGQKKKMLNIDVRSRKVIENK